MKKLLLAALLGYSSFALAQSAIIRGESATPGVYETIKTTGGVLHVTPQTPPVSNSGATTWLASGVRATTQTLADQTNTLYRGIVAACDITVVPGGDTLTLSVQVKETAGGTYITKAANSAKVATGQIVLNVWPAITPVAATTSGHTVSDILWNTWRLVMTHSGAGNFTYSCSYQLLN